MTEFWETAFIKNQLMWGFEPTRSALFARDYFAKKGVKNVLIPGIGYGRNARPFLEQNMSVIGIEISETAISLARSKFGLNITIHHGSVTEMPFDSQQYNGIFCYGLIYLLDHGEREKFIQDCYRQLSPGGHMIFTVISKDASMYGRGTKLGDDWYESSPGVKIYFYAGDSIRREFGPWGLVKFSKIAEPVHGGVSFPFINVLCKRS